MAFWVWGHAHGKTTVDTTYDVNSDTEFVTQNKIKKQNEK